MRQLLKSIGAPCARLLLGILLLSVMSWGQIVTDLSDPGSNGIVKRTGLGLTGVSTSSDILGLWTGTCNASSFLRGDGACSSDLTATTYSTVTNCAAVGTAASPSVASCAAAPAGAFSCATNATGGTCRVNTTAVTANSQIIVVQDASLGSKLGVTCNVNNVLSTTAALISARSAATSFTINLGTVSTNPGCFSYFLVN